MSLNIGQNAMPSPESLPLLLPLIAEAYSAAVLAGTDMRIATESLEAVRKAFVNETDPFKKWSAIDDQVGLAIDGALQGVLVNLRDRFADRVRSTEVDRVHDAFAAGTERGWNEWLAACSEALTHWRMELALALAVEEFPFPPENRKLVERIRQWIKYSLHERWPEAYILFAYLAEQDALTPTQRAGLLVFCAEIHLYHFLKFPEAKLLLERAEALVPPGGSESEALVTGAWAEYWLEQGQIEKAKDLCQKVIDLNPIRTGGYTLMGQCYERQNDLSTAEEWYREAIKKRSGNSLGYRRLLGLYGRPELLGSHENQLQPLLERAIMVNPEGKYRVNLDMAYVYQQSKDYQKAYDWYNRAISIDPVRLAAYTDLGYASIEEQRFDQAHAAFAKAIEVAPESFDGHWGMAWLYEQQQEWEKALTSYEECLPRRAEWESQVRTKIGDLWYKLGRYREAVEEATEALEIEPTNPAALDTLEGIAADYYKTQADPDAAVHIYETIRRTKGEPYEAVYHNRIGNLQYYRRDYANAIKAYQAAIKADSSDPVYHSNLALAWENFKAPGQRLQAITNAVAALDEALRLRPQDNDYQQRHESLALRKGFGLKCGEAAFDLAPPALPLAVSITPDLLGYVASSATEELLPEILELTHALRTRIGERLGVQVPAISFKDIQDASIPEGTYLFSWIENPIGLGRLSSNGRLFRFFPGPRAQLESIQTSGQQGINPHTGSEGWWVAQDDWTRVEGAGLELWKVMEYPIRHLQVILEKIMFELIGHQEVLSLFEGRKASDVLKKSPHKLTALTEVIRGLLAEEVPIKALDQIGEEFDKLSGSGKSLTAIVEGVRSVTQVRSGLPGNNDRFNMYRLGERFEAHISRFVQREDQLEYLALEQGNYVNVLEALRNELVNSLAPTALLVEHSELRGHVRRLIGWANPNLPVLSRSEFLPELETMIRGEIELA
jgi:tetratricopeptide (TPR) repeat protein